MNFGKKLTFKIFSNWKFIDILKLKELNNSQMGIKSLKNSVKFNHFSDY